MINILTDLAETTGATRVGTVALMAVGAHLSVLLIRKLIVALTASEFAMRWIKLRTFVSLVESTLVFTIYFGAFGLMLHEFGVSLTAYLASASIIGLAVGFGSQGLVQDVVTGLTLILSDLFQIGDMVQISGQTGIVKSIGIRFIVLLDASSARVFIPNRTISNVLIYPRGYLRCYVDVSVSKQAEKAALMVERITALTAAAAEQFNGAIRQSYDIGAPQTTAAGRVLSG